LVATLRKLAIIIAEINVKALPELSRNRKGFFKPVATSPIFKKVCSKM
jgi:hypothetical protein